MNPIIYIVKLRFAGVYLFFLCSLQNINCGYALEPPRLADENFQILQLEKSLYKALASFRNDSDVTVHDVATSGRSVKSAAS